MVELRTGWVSFEPVFSQNLVMIPTIKRIIIFSFFIVNNFAAAKPQKACFCEAGTYPEYQRPAFAAGCRLWLKEQKDCATKHEVQHGVSYADLPLQQDLTHISIGYVGHWINSQQLLSYLHSRINPLMSQKGLSVSIDNTACSSMNDPSLILDYVKNMAFQKDQNLIIKGNQTRSVGKWDALIGSKNNFYAFVKNTKKEVIYPNCREFQNYRCLQGVQANDEAVCTTDNSQLMRLRCCQVPDNPYDDEIETDFAWLPISGCY